MPGPKLNENPVRARKTGARGVSGHSVKATAKFVRTSPYKVRVVLDLVRGHDVAEAANILRFCERDAAITVGKVLRSAVANAGENDDIPPEELYVSACFCDEGPTIKRFRPRARGRTGAIRKRTSHITVVVSRLPDSLLAQARNISAQAAANRARRTGAQRATSELAAGDTRRAGAGVEETVAGAVLSPTTEFADTASTADGDLRSALVSPAGVGPAEPDLDTRSTEPDVPGADVEDGAITATQQVDAETVETGSEVYVGTPAPLFTAPTGDTDELNKIIGIGPKLAEQLNALGITQFAQLAEMSDADLETIDSAIPRSFDQLADWRTQAQEIVAGTWDRDSENNT